MIEISAKTRKVIRLTFPSTEVEKVENFLEHECANNLPFCKNSTMEGMDRIRLAALKCSDGNYSKLENAVLLAKKDCRDLLMAAGFGLDLEAHSIWAADPLKKRFDIFTIIGRAFVVAFIAIFALAMISVYMR